MAWHGMAWHGMAWHGMAWPMPDGHEYIIKGNSKHSSGLGALVLHLKMLQVRLS